MTLRERSIDKIIKKLKKGDEKAFDTIYEMYVKLIYHVIFQIVKNKLDAEDLTQEVFVKMYENIQSLKDNVQFKYWFLQIAKNHALNYVKKKSYVLNDEYIRNMAAEEEVVDDFEALLNQFKGVLNADEIDIIALHLYHRMTFREIGLLREATTSAVNNKYARAIKKVREFYKEGGIFLWKKV